MLLNTVLRHVGPKTAGRSGRTMSIFKRVVLDEEGGSHAPLDRQTIFFYVFSSIITCFRLFVCLFTGSFVCL